MQKILVIENNSLFLTILLELFKREGWQTIGTCNSQLGLQLAKKQMPDLIVCNVTLSDPNGQQIRTVLRQDPLTKDIPLIFFPIEWFIAKSPPS
jgi:CheY-like chemotaxis protein